MKLVLGLSVAAAAVTVNASAASAQLAPGVAGFSEAPTVASQEEYWFFMRELGRCLVASKRVQSVAFLRTKSGSPEENRAFNALMRRNGNNVCMGNMVSAVIVRAQVRGVIAENLYELQTENSPQSTLHEGRTEPTSVRSIHDFADCYINDNYAAARDLLATTNLGTQKEADRVRQISEGFGPCLPQGREIRIVPTDIRLALAGALYRASINRDPIAQRSN